MAELPLEPELAAVGRRIDRVEGALERAVSESLYRSPAQCRQRFAIILMLVLKHALRGLLFSWPLYLLGVADLFCRSMAVPGWACSCCPASQYRSRSCGVVSARIISASCTVCCSNPVRHGIFCGLLPEETCQ